jgi:two-component system NarL family response regulator
MNEAQIDNALIRVLIVDDHDLFRTGLASLLKSQRDIEVVGQASGGRMGVRLADELRPDVVLMDLRLPDIGGAEAILAIVEAHPCARVLALTAESEPTAVATAIRAGARGFLAKDTPVEEVVVAVRATARGAAWLSPCAAEVVLGQLHKSDSRAGAERAAIDHLTPRERDVLRLIARGLDNVEIAGELGISPRTAKNHVSNILSKLGLSSRIQAAIYAVKEGID